MLDLNDAYIFAKVVEHGGFTAAARRLGRPKSTLSKRVAMLEAGLGARLLQRDARRMVLTDVGVEFHRHVAAMLIEAEAAQAAIDGRLAKAAGPVRITASIITAQQHLAVILPGLAAAYPDVQLILHATDRWVDVIAEGFDVAVRDHLAPLPDSALTQRRVGTEADCLIAAPAYLAHAGMPATPEDLERHDGLLNGALTQVPPWRLIHMSGGEQEVRPRMRFFSDDPVGLIQMAASGFGIACLPLSVCASGIQSGDLLRVLPDWSARGATTTILYPHRRGQLPAVKAVVDYLAREMSLRLRAA
ncbi:MAG: LysR substrate-binding domain-containing protein [Brevundimonas sp.]|uniref:LysR substrate-binding domain-containing protein n=1 Tax=Brevundimonas sp. TaxID=1871086 RepID=UPI00391CC1D0